MLEKLRKLLKERFADTKYLLKFTLIGGTTISVVKDEENFNEFMTWYNSPSTNEFLIKNRSGFISINKEHLIEFHYSEITPKARIAAPIGYVLFHPVPKFLTLFSYLTLLLTGFVGSIVLLYLKNDLNISNLYLMFGHCFEFIGGFYLFFYTIISAMWAIKALLSDNHTLIDLDRYLSCSYEKNVTKFLFVNAVLIFVFFSRLNYGEFRAFVTMFFNY
ncbi:hypothetical protein Desaci_4068 [Desulfosporosinus acidiphilus SJ4]|uniref:Uncharacterized protein n=1 Tax=Desulfosporosinus acidiphilus (strain DSM 22704 / JCM 16185 / SJ4) TaxID=646529 RepID=I4DAV7_DESAJ|nr:hypothetical protein [Desulfosporosinus acidiphilus]AFM42931.1 hypothetical protein Desaci_4068 [Desulfosporosinus acidiphilus SJ4]